MFFMNRRGILWNWAFLAGAVLFTARAENAGAISDEVGLSEVVLSVHDEYRGQASLRIQGNITRPLSGLQKLFLIAPLKMDETHETIPVYTFRVPYFKGSKTPKSLRSRVMGGDLGSFSVSGKDLFLTVTTNFRANKYRFRIGELGGDKKVSLLYGVRLMCRVRFPERGKVARENYILFFDLPEDLKSDTEKTLETIGPLVEALKNGDPDEEKWTAFHRLLLFNLAAEEPILTEALLGYMEYIEEFPPEALGLVHRLTRDCDVSENAVRVLGHYGDSANFAAAQLMEEIWKNRQPDWRGYSELIFLHAWGRKMKTKIQTLGKIGDESLLPQLRKLTAYYLENYISKLPEVHAIRLSVEEMVLLEISRASRSVSERNKR